MGLSIHYKGAIKDRDLIDTMGYEVIEIADELGWFWDKISGDDFEGVMFAAEGSERIQLHFDDSGKIVAGEAILHGMKSPATISCKTQYAGADAHIAILKLLRYLSDKYFAEFTLIDEGGYWETGDEAVLRKQFAAFDSTMGKLGKMLDPTAPDEEEGAAGTMEKLEEILRRR